MSWNGTEGVMVDRLEIREACNQICHTLSHSIWRASLVAGQSRLANSLSRPHIVHKCLSNLIFIEQNIEKYFSK